MATPQNLFSELPTASLEDLATVTGGVSRTVKGLALGAMLLVPTADQDTFPEYSGSGSSPTAITRTMDPIKPIMPAGVSFGK